MVRLSKHKQNDTQKSTNVLKDLVDRVIDLAQKKGATDAVAALNNDVGFSVDVRLGQTETLAFNEDKGISVTVYLGQQKGSASSTDFSDAAIDAMVQAAIDIAEVSAADPCFGLPEPDLMTQHYPDLGLMHEWSLTPEEAIARAKSCEELARSLHPAISNSDGSNVSTYRSFYCFKNTAGGEGIVESSRHSMSVSLIAGRKHEMQRDYAYTVARCPSELASIDAIAQEAVARTVDRLGARKLQTQKMPIIFSNRVSSGLISSLIQAISGSNLYRKNSFLLDSLGKQIMPEFVDLYEQPHLKGALGSAVFDGEGVPTRPNKIVQHGILNQYVLGCYSARKLGLETTANSGGVHNLTVRPTHDTLDAILKTIDRGFLVTELMGQGVNILTGDYSRGASGFYVENGVIQFPVEGVTIAGNLKDMFMQINAIGADLNPNFATRCGSIAIREMMLAGE